MSDTLQEQDLYMDYQVFYSSDFDPKVYINTTLNESTVEGDISMSLTKISFSIDNLNKKLHDQVVVHFEDLLVQAAGIRKLDESLGAVRDGIQNLFTSIKRLSAKIHTPYAQFKNYAIQLERLQSALVVLRNVINFLNTMKRLQVHLEEIDESSTTKIGHYEKAASIIRELEELLQEGDFQGVEIVEDHLILIQQAKEGIRNEAIKLLQEGINLQDETKVAFSLRIFQSLHELGDCTIKYVEDLLETISLQIQNALNISSIQREVKDSGVGQLKGMGRLGVEVPGTTNLWSTIIWKRLEILLKEISQSCNKIYTLERVLTKEKDPITQIPFLDEVGKILDSELVHYFWKNLSLNFEKGLKESSKGSSFVQQTLVSGYPRLLRLFRDFFATVESSDPRDVPQEFKSQAYVVMLHSISNFELGYLSRSLTRLYEPINSGFTAGLLRSWPSKNDITNVVKAISSELDDAQVGSQLTKSIAKNVAKALNYCCNKAEAMAASDPSSYQISGISPATSSQNINFELVGAIYLLYQSVYKICDQHQDIIDIVNDAIQQLKHAMLNIMTPLITSIKKDLETTLLKIHREDFSRQQVSKPFIHSQTEAQCSSYMTEFLNRLKYLQKEFLSRFSFGVEGKQWIKAIAKRILNFWLLQISLVRPLSEAGKLKLTNDITQLEFSLNQVLANHGLSLGELGQEYKALRAFRQLLFLDYAKLPSIQHTSDIPLLILLHHIIVRSPANTLQLPHKTYGWSEAEYSKWLDEHTDSEGLALVKTSLRSKDKSGDNEEEETEELLVKMLLKERAGIEV
ncbi:hypothetical protein G9A89_018313 [Geosiphon pyriformis]|nr:hypothetical protein G9A89_018313 [Geosiphon pyriformis]